MITSRQNPQVKQWLSYAQKKHRQQSQLYLVEGEHLVSEALSSNLLELLIVSEDYSGKISFQNSELISRSVAEKLSSTQSSQSIFGLVKMVEKELSGTRWLFCDAIQDPGNIGTLIRSAHSFGYNAVILNNQCADLYSDKVIRSTQGAHFHIPVFSMEFEEVVQVAKKSGLQLVGTYLTQETQEIPSNHICLCLGNEGSGLNKDYQSKMDVNSLVETSNFESLNVAVAGSILMYKSRG